jgi:hypothetical protein
VCVCACVRVCESLRSHCNIVVNFCLLERLDSKHTCFLPVEYFTCGFFVYVFVVKNYSGLGPKEMQFLPDALHAIIACRNVLKNSYAYAFYLTDPNHRELFLLQQVFIYLLFYCCVFHVHCYF